MGKKNIGPVVSEEHVEKLGKEIPTADKVETPVRHVSVSVEDRLCPVQLTDTEKLQIGQKLADAYQRQTELKKEIDEFKAGAKSREQSIEGEIGIKSSLLRQGYEHRQVECETVKDYDKGTIATRRLDTQEVIETRNMNGSEKQMGFDSIEADLKRQSEPGAGAGANEVPFGDGPGSVTRPTPAAEEQIQEAIKIIQETRRASVSSLQRRMKISYTSAAMIMDILEVRKIVGPANGAEPREILPGLETGKGGEQ